MPNAFSLPAASLRSHRLRAQLRATQDDHDAVHRACRAGVTAEALGADHRLWEAVGAAIADLARLISGHCAASAFADARPDIAGLTARLCESIDDQIDEPAWTVIDAAARLAASETPR